MAAHRIPLEVKSGHLSIHLVFEWAAPDVDDPRFIALVRSRLSSDPATVRAWQEYSYDKRTSPSPYLDGGETVSMRSRTGTGSSLSFVRYDNPVDACADFIYREAVWILYGRRGDQSGPVRE